MIYLCILVSVLSESHCRNLPPPGTVPDNNLSLPRSVLDVLARVNIVSLLDSLVYGSSGDMNSAGLSLDTLGKGNIL